MKRIIFILSLILMIGTQIEAKTVQVYEGACLDIIQQDPLKDFYYDCVYENCQIIPAPDFPFLVPCVQDGYVHSMSIDQFLLEEYCYKNGLNEYFDIPVQVRKNDSYGNIYNCYIRIQFIKK